MGLVPDGQRYFDLHHSSQDVWKTSKRELELGAAACASMVLMLTATRVTAGWNQFWDEARPWQHMRLDVVAVHTLLSELAGMVPGRLVVVQAEHVARLACGQDARR